MKRLFCLTCAIIFSLLIVFSCAQARPPKPGPNFVWIAPHTNAAGILVPGHWNYIGPANNKKVWVPAHYNKFGKMVPGHWSNRPYKKNKVWVPGHHGPKGRWIPGHYK